MRYLLDTNVISERTKLRPNKSVIDWMDSVPQDKLYVSVLTLGEIRYGIELSKSAKQRVTLCRWIDDFLLPWFGDRIIPIDHIIADRWGTLNANSKNTLPAVDSLLAATALVCNMVVVTGDKKDLMCPA